MKGKPAKDKNKHPDVFIKVGKPLTFTVDETEAVCRQRGFFSSFFSRQTDGRMFSSRTVNACCDLCYRCAFLSHVWSQLFMPARDSAHCEPISSTRNRTCFMQRCFVHESSVDRFVCLAFTLLWLFLWCSVPGPKPMIPKNRIHAVRGFRQTWTQSLPRRLEVPHVFIT